MLDLEFDQEQELLRQTVRDVLQRHCPLDVVRAMEDDPTGYPAELWTQLGELDLIGLLLPEEYGGSGMSLLEGVALYEELGRALAPTPHFVSAVMCGGVLAAAGNAEQKDRWLPRDRHGRGRRSRRPGSSPRTASRLAASRCVRWPSGSGFTLVRREAPRRVRLVGRPSRRARPHG